MIAGDPTTAPRREVRVTYQLIEHPDEIELQIEDANLEAVLAEALLALGDVFADASAESGTAVTHEVVIRAEDFPALLGAWMEELVRLAEADGFIPERVETMRLEQTSVVAVVAGERGIAQSKIKAVSYERLEIRRLEDGAWAASVILDV
jgi:SHS2 domain-containing protein